MPRMEHLIWNKKQLALGLVNPQQSSPSTLMNKECTVCGELKNPLRVCSCVSSQATVQRALHRHEWCNN